MRTPLRCRKMCPSRLGLARSEHPDMEVGFIEQAWANQSEPDTWPKLLVIVVAVLAVRCRE